MIDVNKAIRKVLEIELPVMVAAARKELEAQGHKLTGALIRSVDFKIERTPGGGIEGTVFLNYYGEFVNTGVKAARIPFSPGSGRKSSKYIDALVSYFKLRGVNGPEARRAAFATAMKHKKEGMPTRASRRFSNTGRRTGALNVAVEKASPKIFNAIEDNLERILLARVSVPFNELQKIV